MKTRKNYFKVSLYALNNHKTDKVEPPNPFHLNILSSSYLTTKMFGYCIYNLQPLVVRFFFAHRHFLTTLEYGDIRDNT